MSTTNARLIARNIFAKHSGCTRREAARVLLDISDDDCQELADMNPEDAAKAVKQHVLENAEQIVSDAAKEPSDEASAGLSEAAEAATNVRVNEGEIVDGEKDIGLNPD